LTEIDGEGCITANVSQEVEVITAVVDIEEIRTFRASASRNLQADRQPKYERIEVDFRLGEIDDLVSINRLSPEINPYYHKPEEEIHLACGVWLWQYLCRSGSAGFMLPLSGGLDSCATALLVLGTMRLVMESIEAGDKKVLADAQRITGEGAGWMPRSPEDLVSRLFCTA